VKVKIYGSCRVHDCCRKAEVFIIHETPDGRFYFFREYRIHAKDWEDVGNVVLIKGGEEA